MKKSHYEELGVDRDADAETIKKAHRKKAKETHPDIHGPASEEAFKRVNSAYACLADPATRADYDRFGEAGDSPQSLRQKAEAQIALMLVQAVQAMPDIEHKNVIFQMIDSINLTIAQTRENIRNIQKTASKFRNAATRIIKKNGAECSLSDVLENVAREGDEKVKSLEFDIEKGNAMLDILAGHEWKVDSYPQGNNFTSAWRGITWTGM